MSRIQPKTQRSIIAHKSTCAPSGSIPHTGYTKKHSSISWSVSDDTRGNLPRAKKQSTGLFFVRCGALPCSIPRTGYTKKHSSISWSVSGDTRGNLPRAKKQSTGLFFCALRRTALFDSLHGIHEKTLQHKLECFLVTHAGISRGLKNSPLDCFFVRCGALPCSIPCTGYTKKHSSISWSVFW